MSNLKKTGTRLIAEGARAFETDMGRASAAVRDFGKAGSSLDTSSLNKNLSAINVQQIGQTLTQDVTRPLTGVAAESINTAATFEETLSGIQAVLNPTASDMDALRAEAIRLGSSTKFSAQESALAIEMLAKNGLNAQEILGGALEASLSFASATGADLASSADIATDAMLAFGKEAGDLPDVVNQLVGVTVNSKFGWQDLSLALAQGGGVFAGVGGEIEDFATILAGTSHLFKSGSDAGTSLKVMMTRLIPSSENAAEAMRELGIITADGQNQFFTASGELQSMAHISGVMARVTAGLSEEQKNQYLTTIFGQDAMRAAIATAQLGTDGFLDMQASIAQVDAGEQARIRMDNFKGSLEELRGAAETLQIDLGTRLLPTLRSIVQEVTRGVNWFGNLPTPVQNTALAFGAAVAAAGPLLLALGLVSGAIAAIPVAVATLAPIAPAFAGLAAAGAVLATAWITDFGGIRAKFETWAPKIQSLWSNTVSKLSTDWQVSLDNINTALSNHGTALDSTFSDSQNVTERVWKVIARTVEDATNIVGGSITGVTSLLKGDWKGAQEGAERVAESVWSQISMRVETAWSVIGPILDTFGVETDGLKKTIIGLRDDAGRAINELKNIITATFGDIGDENTTLGRRVSELQATWTTMTTTVVNLVTPMWSTVQSLFQAGRDFLDRNSGEIKNFIDTNFTTVGKIIGTTFEIASKAVQAAFELIDATIGPTLTTIVEFVERNQDDIGRFFDGTWTVISSLITGTLSTILFALQGTLAIMRGDWEGAFNSFAGIVDVQATAIDSAIGGLGDMAKSGVSLAGDGVLSAWQSTWNSAWNVVDGFFARFVGWSPNTEPIRQAGDNLINSLRDGMERTWSQIWNFFPVRLGFGGEGLATRIGEFAGNWADSGANLIYGIKDGMSRAWGELENWFWERVESMPDLFGDVLGISSPSEVMAQKTGEPMPQGIGVGFMRAFDPMEQQMVARLDLLTERLAMTGEVGRIFGAGMAEMVPYLKQDIEVLKSLDMQLDSTSARMQMMREITQAFSSDIQRVSVQLQRLPVQAGEVQLQLQATHAQMRAMQQTTNNYNLNVSSNAPMASQQAEFNAMAVLNQ